MSTLTQRPEAGERTGGGGPRGPRRRRFTALEVGGACLGGLGAAVVANAAFGVSTPLAVVAIGYAAFVVTVAFVELTGDRAREANEIDLTAEADREEHFERAASERVSDTTHDTAILRSVPDADELPDVPVRRRSFNAAELVQAGVAALVAGAVAEGLRVVLHMHSLVGLTIWWYVVLVGVYYLLARDQHDAEAALDRIVTMLVWSAGILVGAVLVWMIVTVITKGAGTLTWGFLTHDLSTTGPLSPGGGALHAIIGTAEQVGLATVVVVPVGIMTAVYLHEIRGRIAGPIRFVVDAMSGLPSIVAGLLIFTAWVIGHGYSGAAGSAALVVLMLPTMTRATEEILRTVPDSLREGALALGSPQWKLVLRVVLPTALAGIVTASLLAIARAIGETAPMLLTAFGADATNANPMHGPQSDLPLFIFKLIFLPNKASNDRAWAGALLLVLFVLVLFTGARLVASRGTRKLGGAR